MAEFRTFTRPPETRQTGLVTGQNVKRMAGAAVKGLNQFRKDVGAGAKRVVGAGDQPRATLSEIGTATRDTLVGPKFTQGQSGGALGVVQETVQSPLRFAARAGLSAIQAGTGSIQDHKITSPTARSFFGLRDGETMDSFQQRAPKQSATLTEMGATRREASALPLAGIAVGGLIDFTGFGSGKTKVGDIAKQLAKESNAQRVAEVIAREFPELVSNPQIQKQLRTFTQHIASTGDATNIQRNIENIVSASRRSRIYSTEEINQSISRQIDELPPLRDGERQVYFYSARGEGGQYVTTDPSILRQNAPTSEGRIIQPFHVANIPERVLNQIKGKPGVYTIKNELAEQIENNRILLETMRPTKSVAPKASAPSATPLKPRPQVTDGVTPARIPVSRAGDTGTQRAIARSFERPQLQRITRTEPVILKERLQNQAVGARAGARETRKVERASSGAIRTRELQELARKNELGKLRQRISDRFRFLKEGVRKGGVDARKQVKATQDELTDLIKGADIEDKARARMLATVKNVQTPKQLERALPRIQERIDRAYRAKENVRIVRDIAKEIERLKPKKGAAGVLKGKLTADQQAKIDEFIDVFNERPVKVDGVDTFPKAEKELLANLDALQKGDGDLYALASRNERLQYAGIFQSTKKATEFDTDHLRALQKDIKDIIEKGKTERERVRGNMKDEVLRTSEALADDVILTQETLRDFPDLANKNWAEHAGEMVGRYLNIETNLDYWAMKAQRYYNTGTENIEGPVYDVGKRLKEAQRNYLKEILDVEETLSNGLAKSYKATRYRDRVKLIHDLNKVENLGEFKLRQIPDELGNLKPAQTIKLKLNRQQMLAKWMQWQQEHTHIRLRQGNGWTDEIMDVIQKRLTPEDKAFGKFLMDEYYPQMRNMSEPAYELYTGLKMPRAENYSPSPTKKGDVLPEHIRQALERAKSSTNPSAIKQRTDLSGIDPNRVVQGLEMDSALETAVGHGAQMAQFVHKTEAVTFWRSLMNKNSKFRKAIDQEFESNFSKQMDNMLDSFATGGVRDKESAGFMLQITGNAATAILGSNISQLPKQLVSTSMWFMEGGYPMMRAFPEANRNFRTLSREMYENSPFLRGRGTKRTHDLNAAEHVERGDSLKKLLKVKGPVDYSMKPVEWGDKGGIMGLGTAYYLSKKKGYLRKGLSNDEAIQKAIRDFEWQAERLQQSSEILNTSSVQREFGFLGRAASLFQGTPKQMLRYELHLIRSLGFHNKAAKKGSRARIIAKIGLIHANFMLFQFVADGFRVDEERMTRSGLLGPFGSLFILGSGADTAIRTIAGDDVFSTSPQLTGLTKLGDMFTTPPRELVKAIKDPTYAMEALFTSMTSVVDFLGVPASNTRDLIEKSLDFAQGKRTDLREFIFSDYALDKDKKPTSSRSGGGAREFTRPGTSSPQQSGGSRTFTRPSL